MDIIETICHKKFSERICEGNRGYFMTDPLNNLADSIAQATLRDLEEYCGKRPTIRDCEVTVWMQGYSSTSLGFPGISGQAMSSGYVVIIQGPQHEACVYVSGRLAFRILRPNDAFYKSIHDMRVIDACDYRGQYDK
jgi:hypothetical protein